MECIYEPKLAECVTNTITISGDEAKHLRVLNLRIDEYIQITDGKGMACIARLAQVQKNSYIFQITELLNNTGELKHKLALAFGILDNRDRFEFAFEKAIELGITDFFPLICEFSQKKKINSERLEAKAIAAMKQSKRSFLPLVHPASSIKDFIPQISVFQRIILADEKGSVPDFNESSEDTIVIVGPEGGFSSKEIELIKSIDNLRAWQLGNRRLRAETAAILAIGLNSNLSS